MNRMWARIFARDCQHEERIVVRSVGVERTVCEDCGHVSFLIASMVPAEAESTGEAAHEDLPRAG